MLEDATTFISGAISAISGLIAPGGTGEGGLGWAALLALSVSGGIIGSAVALIRKFSRRK